MKKKSVSIILADDHQVVRDGLKSMLYGIEEIEIIAQAASGNELLQLLKTQTPDVLILDIELPDVSGLDLCSRVKAEYPGIRILILSMYTGEDFIFKAVAEGAIGYLPKNTTRDELIEAITSASEGKEYFSPSIHEIMVKSYIKKAKSGKVENSDLSVLSKRELEVLKMLAEGLPNYEIAEKLFISLRTVESHKSHIMQKLDFRTTAELVKFAIRNKLIEI